MAGFSFSDDALGFGALAENLACGFDKTCRREKAKGDNVDNISLSFNSQVQESNSNVIALAISVFGLIFLVGIGAYLFLSMPAKKT